MKKFSLVPPLLAILLTISIFLVVPLVDHHPLTDQQWLYTSLAAVLAGFLAWWGLQSWQRKHEAAETHQRQLGEGRLRLALEASHGCYFEYTPDFQRGQADPKWMEITGYAPQDLPTGPKIQAFFLNNIHPEDRERVAHDYAAFIEGRSKHWEFECRFRHKSRVWHWLRGIGRAVSRNPNGEVNEIVGIFFDVTKDKEMEENLVMVQAALEAAANAIVITDADAYILWVNKAFCHLTGYGPEEVIGKNPRILKSGKHDDTFYQQMRQTISAGNVWRGELVNRRKDGSFYGEEMTITPVRGKDGGIHYYIAIKQDITERQRRDAELRQAKDFAEAANRAKSAFLANISHEIRTPMNGILGMTGLMLRTTLTPEQREYQRMVRQSSEALMVLIDDILDFSRIEAGQLHLESVDFDPHACLADTLKAISMRAHEKGLELLADVSNDVPHHLKGDPIRLRQVLLNLVGNAIKFTLSGQVQVTVQTESRTAQGVELHFQVQDTGIGIPRDKLQDIFKPFVQADVTMSRKYGGTGLGLAIATRLVELMGGRIWVESERNRGSTFHFTARFSFGPKPEVHEPIRGSTAGVAGLPVLVVDDNEANLALLRKMFIGWEMRPTTVIRGEQAIQEVKKAETENRPFALILIDAQMPGMDGFELARRLREELQVKSPQIIMLSSLDRTMDTSRCQQYGIQSVLMKPITPSDLWDAVVRAINPQVVDTESSTSSTTWLPVTGRRSYRILLAEDNEINQKLATLILKEMGHKVRVVGNGVQAVKAVKEGTFDLVLMDIQMPVMDGLEATQTIRKNEILTGKHIPIIAMTAHAIQGDRERCLEGGMDGYISKPIRPKDVSSTLNTVMDTLSPAPPNGEKDPMDTSAMIPQTTETILNEVELLERFGGNRSRVGRFAQDFTKLCPEMLSDIKNAIQQKDALRLKFSAHKFKGAISVFTCGTAHHLAQELEEMGSGGDLSHAENTYNHLNLAIERLQKELKTYMISSSSEDR